MLPFLEGNTIHNLFDHKRPLLDPVNLPPPWPRGTNSPSALSDVATFLCPSTPSNQPSDYGPYFTNAGILPAGVVFRMPRTDYAPMRGIHSSLANCVGRPSSNTHNAMLGSSDIVTKRTVTFGEVTDGLSNTFCVLGIAGKQTKFFRGRMVPKTGNLLIDTLLNSFYGDWNIARHVRGLAGTDINNANLAGCSSWINIHNSDNPYSFHPGGVMYLMGDGSVNFLSSTVDNLVFVGLMSRDGGETVGFSKIIPRESVKQCTGFRGVSYGCGVWALSRWCALSCR